MTNLEEYTILVEPKALSSHHYAAKMLAEYLRRISGKFIKVFETYNDIETKFLSRIEKAIFIGPGKHEKFFPDLKKDLSQEEIVILKHGEKFLLTGEGQRGPLYAVVTFLEKYLGCRFYAENIEDIPGTFPELPGKIEFYDKPAFEQRDSTGFYEVSGDFAVKSRINGEFANVGTIQGGRRAFLPFVHSFAALVPAQKYFRNHPEYFSLISERRNPQQLCLSNPKVQELAIRQVCKWFKDYPNFDIVDISENDGGSFCECPECQKMNGNEHWQTGQMLRFVNIIAKAVAEKFPKKKIETIGYGYVREPPKTFRMEPNVIVRLCLDWIVRPENKRHFRDHVLPTWSKLADSIYIWYYSYGTQNYLQHFPSLEEIEETLAEYRDLGVKGVFVQSKIFECGGFESLKLQNYVTSKLLWNPDLKIRPLIEEFMNFYYGPIAEEILSCFKASYKVLNQDKMTVFKGDGKIGGDQRNNLDMRAATLFDYMKKVSGRCNNYLKKAREKCRKVSPVYQERFEEAVIPFEYTNIFSEYSSEITDTYALEKKTNDNRKALKFIDKLVKFNFNEFGEHITLEEYRRSLQKQPVKTLSSDKLRFFFLPENDGKILQIRNKWSANGLVPVQSSLATMGCVCRAQEFYGGSARGFCYNVVSSGKNKLTMSTHIEHGAKRFMTKYKLRNGNVLDILMELKNVSDHKQDACSLIHNRFICGGKDKAFLTRNGKITEYALKDFNTNEDIQIQQGVSCCEFHLLDTGTLMRFHLDAELTQRLFIWSSNRLFTVQAVRKATRLAPGQVCSYKLSLEIDRL